MSSPAQRSMLHSKKLRKTRGVTLIESLIAMLVLCFGILGIIYFQANMLAQSVQTKARISSARLADELIAIAQVDPDNAACYTAPQSASCTNESASTKMSEWIAKSKSGAVPGEVSVTSTLEGTRLTVSVSWIVKKGASSHAYTTTSIIE